MSTAVLAPAETRIEGGAKALCWAMASHLLAYPDEEIIERLPLMREAAAHLAEPHRSRLVDLMDALADAHAAAELTRWQETYVETFDTRRRSALYLTYFAHGDTRRRGMAILEIKQALAEAGMDAGERELPDHLCVMLEFAGTVNPEVGERFLRAYRPGLEMVRLGLVEKSSPWAPVMQAVCATLPALASNDREAIERLIQEGPDEELVGLATYGSDVDYQAGPPTTSPMAWDPSPPPVGPASGGPVSLPTPRIPPRTKEPHHG